MWKIINEFPNYSISDKGEVKRNQYTNIDSLGRKFIFKEKILKLYDDKDGYKTVMLRNDKNGVKLCKVHRLVAQAFLDNPNNLPCVNHKDENKTNNCVDNLEFCDTKYNNIYNNRHIKAGLTQRINIYSIDNKGNITYYNGVCEAAKLLKIKESAISLAINGKIKTAYGLKWFKCREVIN